MIERLLHIVTFISALGSGLIAGLFFAFSAFVMAALVRLPSQEGIAAMQSINVTVLNPLFGLVFAGTAIASVILAIASIIRWTDPGAKFLLAGSLLYLIGSFLVTLVCNVPLNDALAAVDPNSTHGTDLWNHYTNRWTAWNHVRTIASLAALASFIIALRQSA